MEVGRLINTIANDKISAEERLLRLAAQFPNERIPGKKLRSMILRRRLSQMKYPDVLAFAEKYSISPRVVRMWLDEMKGGKAR
ncbi:MAG: hypothetical protein WBH56_08770 [Bacteroidota bacterium]